MRNKPCPQICPHTAYGPIKPPQPDYPFDAPLVFGSVGEQVTATDRIKELQAVVVKQQEKLGEMQAELDAMRERAEKAEAECGRLRQALADAANEVSVIGADIRAKLDYEMLKHRDSLRRTLKELSK